MLETLGCPIKSAPKEKSQRFLWTTLMSEDTQDHKGADTMSGLIKYKTALKVLFSFGRESLALGLQVSPQAKVWLQQSLFGK